MRGVSGSKPEPFGIIICCTANPEIADAKTRSKWSRVCNTPERQNLATNALPNSSNQKVAGTNVRLGSPRSRRINGRGEEKLGIPLVAEGRALAERQHTGWGLATNAPMHTILCSRCLGNPDPRACRTQILAMIYFGRCFCRRCLGVLKHKRSRTR